MCFYRNGYLTLEVMLTITLLSLAMTWTMPALGRFLGSIQHMLLTWEATQLCYLARMQAIATNQDVQVQVLDRRLCVAQPLLEGTLTGYCLELPSSFQGSINGTGRLGFKPTGTTQYAGTFTLERDAIFHYVTVQVGVTQINAR